MGLSGLSNQKAGTRFYSGSGNSVSFESSLSEVQSKRELYQSWVVLLPAHDAKSR